MYGLLTMSYDATYLPESGVDQRTDGGHEDHSHTIDFAEFWRNAPIMSVFKSKDSFGSSKVTIAQMCETDFPVLTSRRHAWTSRPRSVC